jgi:hypothetical protein
MAVIYGLIFDKILSLCCATETSELAYVGAEICFSVPHPADEACSCYLCKMINQIMSSSSGDRLKMFGR